MCESNKLIFGCRRGFQGIYHSFYQCSTMLSGLSESHLCIADESYIISPIFSTLAYQYLLFNFSHCLKYNINMKCAGNQHDSGENRSLILNEKQC